MLVFADVTDCCGRKSQLVLGQFATHTLTILTLILLWQKVTSGSCYLLALCLIPHTPNFFVAEDTMRDLLHSARAILNEMTLIRCCLVVSGCIQHNIH